MPSLELFLIVVTLDGTKNLSLELEGVGLRHALMGRRGRRELLRFVTQHGLIFLCWILHELRVEIAQGTRDTRLRYLLIFGIFRDSLLL